MTNTEATNVSHPENNMQRVLVEMRVPRGQVSAMTIQMAQGMNATGFQLDTHYDPVSMSPALEQAAAISAANEEVVVVRGSIEESRIPELEAQPNVIAVWSDAPIAPFTNTLPSQKDTALVQPLAPFAACPTGTCDCDSRTAKGTIAEVGQYLGVDQIWASGFRGEGIVVGILDCGITAEGRSVRVDETSRRIPRVIGGFPRHDWGTTTSAWYEHGNMCATDVLGMAPQAQLYDIRISDARDTPGVISNALAGFQWAIEQHRLDGTPQILSNSWGCFQASWAPDYTTNPNHPFTRKVVEAINEGILVLFAAGNCGETCPDSRCTRDGIRDIGPGRSIWGANGHPMVMTVAAVNKNEERAGYSSEGPAPLDPQKPDFCSITHFKGYFNSDGGTSAATPIAAGVIALLKQVKPTLTQEEAKDALKRTAKDIGPAGWDQYSGAGIIQAKAAFDFLTAAWRDNVKINGLWAINEDRNAWVHIHELGWRKISPDNDNIFFNILVQLIAAKAANRPVNFLEQLNVIKQIYVL